jgi:SAM-dependent methyltransferase
MRASSQPEFWDIRYKREDHLFGTGPNAFVASQAGRVPRGANVVELGAGEGRNLIHLAETRGCHSTAVDFAPAALQQAEALATEHGVALEAVQADVRTWQPNTQWDAVLVTFVQLLPHERPGFYELIRQIVRPGGWVLGEWFRPKHLDGGFDRIGPNAADRMVTADELRHHFDDFAIAHCESLEVTLAEGDRLRGRAAVVRLAAQAPSVENTTAREARG